MERKMSIIKIAQIDDTNSQEYLELISRIYYKFENLHRLTSFYALSESSDYLLKAKKCFEQEVSKELKNTQ